MKTPWRDGTTHVIMSDGELVEKLAALVPAPRFHLVRLGNAEPMQPGIAPRSMDLHGSQHLRHEQPWRFTFLHCPGIDATNNAGEREVRPAGIARKTWGGNRSEVGARSQRTLRSVCAGCEKTTE